MHIVNLMLGVYLGMQVRAFLSRVLRLEKGSLMSGAQILRALGDTAYYSPAYTQFTLGSMLTKGHRGMVEQCCRPGGQDVGR